MRRCGPGRGVESQSAARRSDSVASSRYVYERSSKCAATASLSALRRNSSAVFTRSRGLRRRARSSGRGARGLATISLSRTDERERRPVVALVGRPAGWASSRSTIASTLAGDARLVRQRGGRRSPSPRRSGTRARPRAARVRSAARSESASSGSASGRGAASRGAARVGGEQLDQVPLLLGDPPADGGQVDRAHPAGQVEVGLDHAPDAPGQGLRDEPPVQRVAVDRAGRPRAS